MSLDSDAGVWNTCLFILRQRGYVIHASAEADEQGAWPDEVLWIAEQDGFRFAADNPVELLGLVGIREHARPVADIPYWWYIDGPDLVDEVMLKAFPAN